MVSSIYVSFSRVAFGKGEKVPGYIQLYDLHCKGLYRSYYANTRTVTPSHVRKYYRGTAALPHGLRKYYSGEKGYDRLYADIHRMMAFVCTSITGMQHICADIYNWSQHSILDKDTLAAMSEYYVEGSVDPREMATYIAHMLHYTLGVT